MQLTGNDQRNRRMKRMKQMSRTIPIRYHFDFFQIIFLNVRNGDVNQRNEVTGRLRKVFCETHEQYVNLLTEVLRALDVHWVSLGQDQLDAHVLHPQSRSPVRFLLFPTDVVDQSANSMSVDCLTVNLGWPSCRSIQGHQPLRRFI